MSTLNSISLLIILGVVLSGTGFFVPPTARAAQLLDEVTAPPPGDDRSKIGASPSTPRQAGSWSGGSSPQGQLLVPPPSSVTRIEYQSRNVTSSMTSSTTVNSNGTTTTTASSNVTVTGSGGVPPP
ncbi:hypothetical protein MLD38_004373 [Melastoma candidum]|uniref:Uncharacterized protein n=1 Tax=Melastoma candidum TaxID=119954 RepID=A0ACB9S5F5_9MYRT|nr:hypothetical protein MLD38_004373 [Melastoma candidum]